MPRRPAPPLRFFLLVCTLALAAPPPALAADDADLAAGKQIFTTESAPPCGVCHTLADAGTTGTVGPSLDALKPTEDQVGAAVRSGVGVMPPYEGLSDEQIAAVARYVATVAGKAE